MVNRIGYPDYILNETVIIAEYDNISLSSNQFLGINKAKNCKNASQTHRYIR